MDRPISITNRSSLFDYKRKQTSKPWSQTTSTHQTHTPKQPVILNFVRTLYNCVTAPGQLILFATGL